MMDWKPCHIKKQISIGALYTAFRELHGSVFNFEGETHNFWELVCVLSGTVGVAADSQIFSVPSGHVIVYSPMTFHRMWAENGSSPELLTVTFDCETTLDLSDTVYHLSEEMMKEMCSIVYDIRKYFEVGEEVVKHQISASAQIAVNRLENFVISLLPRSSSGDNVCSTQTGVRKYTEIVRCLYNNLDRNLTIEQIAAACSMSPSSVKQIFKRFTGIGVMQFYRRMKMDKAIAMLRRGVSVKEISRRLGYGDPNYFSTVFKREIGISPMAYVAKMHDHNHNNLR